MEECCHILEHAALKDTYDLNHVYIHFIPVLYGDIKASLRALHHLLRRYASRLWQAKITAGEIVFRVKSGYSMGFKTMRMHISSKTGLCSVVNLYLQTASGWKNVDNGLDVAIGVYPCLTESTLLLQKKRNSAHALKTTYVYDMVDLLELAFKAKYASFHCVPYCFIP